MLRFATSYILIALVLICPQLCWGEPVDGPGDEVGCCCAEHHDRSSGETPDSPERTDADCLCQRAIMDGVRLSELDSLTPIAVAWLISDAIVPSKTLALADYSSESPHQFPPFCSGRDVCVLTCALLL